jgi:voltage-gated sodium channel
MSNNTIKEKLNLKLIQKAVSGNWFQNFITLVIVVNAVTLGLETSDYMMKNFGPLLIFIDQLALKIFILEILLKIYAYRFSFFKQGWNIFDFLIVGIALFPSSGPLSVLRALRILRVLRLFSIVPKLRSVINALLDAIPGMFSIIGVLLLVFYIASVLSTKLFGTFFPDWFGSIGKSMYSLFQIMTLESWSMGIVRPVLQIFPLAWLFFVPFIIITSFTVLNLFIAILVSATQSQHEAERKAEMEGMNREAHDERILIVDEIRNLRTEIEILRKSFKEDGP